MVNFSIFSASYTSPDTDAIFSRNYSDFPPLNGQADDVVALKELWALGKNGSLDELSAKECITAYGTAFQTSRGSVLLIAQAWSNETAHDDLGVPTVAGSSTFTTNSMEAGCAPDVYEWVCGPAKSCKTPCRDKLDEVKANASDWWPFDHHIVRCFSQSDPQDCRLHFNTRIMTVVIVTNAVKVAVMLWLAFRHPPELLLVIGDAIMSFLASPDAYSTNSCLARGNDVKEVLKKSRKKSGKMAEELQLDPTSWMGPRQWTPARHRWGAAVSRRRWKLTAIL